MTDQEIINKAPAGAVFCDTLLGKTIYVMLDQGIDYVWLNEKEGWQEWEGRDRYPFSIKLRSLSDIREIVDLRSKASQLEFTVGQQDITIDHSKTRLAACEAALQERDAKIETLQKECIVVGMELVVEEFAPNNFGSFDAFEVQPSQIYDYCDEIYGGDSTGIRSKYDILPQKPPMRDTLTLALKHELAANELDLIETQKSLSALETKHESIELLFCDNDGNPLFEPFNDKTLSAYLEKQGVIKFNSGIDAAIQELEQCYEVALRENDDIDDANSIEVLIDRIQQLRKQIEE